MVSLVDKLENWEEVYPEDLDKPCGHLYYESAEYIRELESRLAETATFLRNILYHGPANSSDMMHMIMVVEGRR